MAITRTTDLVFENQIALDHAFAYFNTKLGWANLVWRARAALMAPPGDTLTIPFFTTIGPAETPLEGVKYNVDKLTDNEFKTTVKLVGKAVGLTDETIIKAGFTSERWFQEAIEQIEQRLAEKVQEDIITEFNLPTSHEAVNFASDLTFTTAFDGNKNINTDLANDQKCNVRSLSKGMQEAFGDKRSQTMAFVLHSHQAVDLETDTKTGFLQADANSPFNLLDEFRGMIFRRPVLEFDSVPKGAKITFTDSAAATQKFQTYKALVIKKDPLGLIVKKEPILKSAEDMLGRTTAIASTRWYAVKSFHGKISTDDKRAAFLQFLTEEETT